MPDDHGKRWKQLQESHDRYARLFKFEQSRRVEAERANKIKDEFLAKLSHDLRTPLNSILTWVVLLRNGQLDEEQRARACETIERNTRLQVKLIADLLDVSAILAGKLSLNRENVDLGELARSVIDDLGPAAVKKGVDLAAGIDPTLGPVFCDPVRIHQVLNNLLQNAVKFSPASSTVQLIVSRGPRSAVVSVVDSGQGIPPEALRHIFEPFRQGNGVSRDGGLGLGLAIVKEIVQMHGGEITAHSDGEGRGSTFEMTLPLAPPAAQEDRNLPVETAGEDLSPEAADSPGLRPTDGKSF